MTEQFKTAAEVVRAHKRMELCLSVRRFHHVLLGQQIIDNCNIYAIFKQDITLNLS